jgi:acetyl-CoA carboxylase biotin carboxylase subunit
MNTRLQVEHPVTELVTGIDLVREQINVAAGKPLSFSQEDVRMSGHAIECRIYAEDPENNFLPSPGKIRRLRIPQGPGVRDDGGVFEGAEVSIFYDPMISKFAVWGRDRAEAIDRMRRALDEYEIAGIKTTLPFFREVLRDEAFIAGELDTGFISEFNKRRHAGEMDPDEIKAAIIAAALSHENRGRSAAANQQPSQSKWAEAARLAALRPAR